MNVTMRILVCVFLLFSEAIHKNICDQLGVISIDEYLRNVYIQKSKQ